MDWFKHFVDESRDIWADSYPPTRRVASFREWLENFDGEESGIGAYGEDFVKDLLTGHGYFATRVDGSRTPADVWAICPRDGYIHVPLIQVKATVTMTQPQRLSADELNGLRELAAFVGWRLSRSVFVPADFQGAPRFISAGYAGVMIDPIDVTPELESAYMLNYSISRSLQDRKQTILADGAAIHRLR